MGTQEIQECDDALHHTTPRARNREMLLRFDGAQQAATA